MLQERLYKAVRDTRNIFRSGYRLLRWDYQTLLLFEFAYKLCALVLLVPLLKMLLQWAIELGGVKVLNQVTLLTLMRRPWCVPILLILGCILVFLEFIELTVIIHYFDAAQKKEKVTIGELLCRSWRQSMRICQPRNICLLLFVALVIPLTNLTFSSSMLSTMQIPSFVSEYMKSRNTLLIPYTFLGAVAVIICYRWIFSLHEYTIEHRDFGKACAKSNHLVKGRMLRIVLVFVEWSIVLALVGYILYFVFLLLSALGIKALWNQEYESATFWSWYNLVGKWKKVITEGLTVVAKYAWISAAWYYIGQKTDPELEVKREPVRVERSRHGFWLRALLLIVLIGGCAHFSGSGSEWRNTMMVCAHRGATSDMPENTLESIQKIVRDNVVSAVEIDVRQTKDGRLILLHDDNFKRVAGVNRKVWDVTYEEAREYDVGSGYGEEWRGTRIAELETVLDYLKTVPWIRVIIELKDSGYEEKVLEAIRERGMNEQCIIASMNYGILQQVKKLDKEATTQLITFIAYGKLYTLEDVDMYSIEASFVTQKLVNALQALDKPLYVWTVNQNRDMKKLRTMQVDCVITDKAYWADSMLSQPADDRIISAMVRMLLRGSESILVSS